jgi:hypothetical protein
MYEKYHAFGFFCGKAKTNSTFFISSKILTVIQNAKANKFKNSPNTRNSSF